MAEAERQRLREARDGTAPWKRWGPYLAERAWGTVREDYSESGDAWSFFPHDHARSRAYRWNEDGLAGISDDDQLLCFALALWNGRDPILKERIFGLTGPQGNHGEDPKEQWFYVDSTPTHSWMVWRYLYPHARFPYEELIEQNRHRRRDEPELELADLGVFDDGRFWDVTVHYAKAGPDDLCVLVRVRNAGPEEASVDVLPTVWFRNTWSWGLGGPRPQLRADERAVVVEHEALPPLRLVGEGRPDLLFCENETNAERLWGTQPTTPYPKDGINDHVVHGAATVNPARTGTKAALRYRLTIAPGDTAEIRLRLGDGDDALGTGFERVMLTRRQEADDFYAALTPAGIDPDEALVFRQACAGMAWTKQWYHYDVARWLTGDPASPAPPAARWSGRNSHWRHLHNADVVSMPDKWEYPWYAVWDSAFHCIPIAHADIDFAKDQLLLFLDERYLHPNGQIPAYEWNFGDVNPPVHAWATLRVFDLDGGTDHDFLARVFHKLLLNFTWWVNKKDAEGNNLFEGGFLGLDNIGPIDRSASLPSGLHLEQSDGSAWMAMYSLNMLEMALRLAEREPSYEGVASKFLEHFTHIAAAMNAGESGGLWDDDDGFYYDVLHVEHGESIPLRVRSMVGLIPLYAVLSLEPEMVERFPHFAERKRSFLRHRIDERELAHLDQQNDRGARLLSVVSPERLRTILATVLSEEHFLAPTGLRSLSAWHRERPLSIDLGGFHASVGYEPAESMSPMFGGNSNWRGPIWFPVNYLLIESLRRFHAFLGDDFTVEHPTGSGRMHTLEAVADDLSRRLISTFTEGADGGRPVYGDAALFRREPWRGLVPFHEYFHGDTGAGLGAPHQTGWTGLVADLIIGSRRPT